MHPKQVVIETIIGMMMIRINNIDMEKSMIIFLKKVNDWTQIMLSTGMIMLVQNSN